MSKYVSCGKAQSVLNSGNLCKEYFRNPKVDVVGDWVAGFTDEQINKLPALPDNWDTSTYWIVGWSPDQVNVGFLFTNPNAEIEYKGTSYNGTNT